MAINFSKFFLNKPVFLLSLVAALFISGVFSFARLNRNEDPGFKIRTASIITSAPMYCAYDVDKGITRPIEETINVMEEIEDIKSESYQGRSVIYADLFEYYKDIQPIWDRLRRKVDLSKNKIFDGLTPVVNDEYGDVFGILIGVSKEGAKYEEIYDITRKIKNELFKLKSKGRVEIFGTVDEALYLNFKTSYLSNLKLTPDEIKNFVNSINRIKSGGGIYSKNDFYEINSTSSIKNENEIKERLFSANSIPIPFDSIFNIEKTTKKYSNDEKIVKSNGKEGLIIGVSLKKDGNIISLGKEIKAKLKTLSKKYPDINLEILSMQSDYVKYLTDKFTQGLFESILAVILVVLLFLGFKTGLIIGLIIVLTVVSTFFVMNIFNIGLDKISLSALIISLGILVDNSIVIAEAAIKTKPLNKETMFFITEKFQTPLLIVTVSASLAFFPVFIADSTVGEYSSSLFKVVFIVLIFSWFYSISFLPYLILKFSSKLEIKENKFFITDFLTKKINSILNYKKELIIFSFSLFIFSIFLFSFVPKIFFPESDRNAYEIRLNLKNGVNLSQTKEAIEKVENFLNNKKVKSYSSYIGTSAPRYVLSAAPEADKLNFGMILVNVKSYKTVDNDILETKKFINKNLQNAQAVVRKIPLGPPVDAPVEIRIIDNDIDKLFYYKKEVEAILSKIKGVYLVKDNWGEFIPEYKIKINENASILAGISPEYLFDWLNTVYNGKILTYYFREDIKIPVILKADDDFLSDPSQINSVSIYSKNKNSIIPISQIAEIKKGYTYPKILRRNGSYTLTVQAWIEPYITSNSVIQKTLSKLDKIKGLKYEIGGEYEKSKKGNKSVIEKIPIAFLIIFLILILYFNSIKKPLLIVLSGVLALTGANIGLFITGSNFGFMTFLGYISLVGISMNNGVILLNEIKDTQNENEIISAVQSRVEPVLLTCFTTIGGMTSLWIKNDPMFSTLAVSIIFGLIFSVFITLFVLPCLYFLVSKR